MLHKSQFRHAATLFSICDELNAASMSGFTEVHSFWRYFLFAWRDIFINLLFTITDTFFLAWKNNQHVSIFSYSRSPALPLVADLEAESFDNALCVRYIKQISTRKSLRKRVNIWTSNSDIKSCFSTLIISIRSISYFCNTKISYQTGPYRNFHMQNHRNSVG